MNVVNNNQISISAWNIHGLGDKTNDEFFLKQIKSDINILLETWKGESKEHTIPGFNTISKIRDFNSRTGDNFAQTNLLPDENKIDNCFNRYSCDKVINGQGINLLDLSTSSSLRILNGRYIVDIMGNFTCMTSNGSSFVDYAIVNESLLSSVEYFKTRDFNSRTGDNFPQTNLLPDENKIDNCFNRYSCDKVINGQGINLLDLSTSSSLRILNGRYIVDIMGNFTCMTSNGSSFVDYAIVNESLLSSVEYFKTQEYWKILKEMKKTTKHVDNSEEILKNLEELEQHFQNQGNCSSVNKEFQKHIETEFKNIEDKMLYINTTDKPFTLSEVKIVINKLKTAQLEYKVKKEELSYGTIYSFSCYSMAEAPPLFGRYPPLTYVEN
ncbi:unnamed protein product [Mytilus coruscus]|uniref:Endonuclease/exonuclease/phosphatase domain-containing protein n=1 Tax=Mytilus coruscus TaxID=42192 RepID=A0A6J8EYS2_MYTCO|nr:unnamed protein product [Mytilus coruscus]